MGKQDFKKEINNFNPYNRIKLNQFHQEQDKKVSEGKQLRKKQRDLERLVNYQGLDENVKKEKEKELVGVQEELTQRKKSYERQKRKEFFIEKKYGPIKQVELTKLYRMIKKNQALQNKNEGKPKELKQEMEELKKKVRYVKNFPKDMKYLSLFPNNELAEEAKAHQLRIMDKIEREYQKSQRHLNVVKPEHGKKKDDKRIGNDEFFIVENEEQPDEEAEEIEEQQEQPQQNDEDDE